MLSSSSSFGRCCFCHFVLGRWVLLGKAGYLSPLSWEVVLLSSQVIFGSAVFPSLALWVLPLPTLGGAVSWIGLQVVLVTSHCASSRTSECPNHEPLLSLVLWCPCLLLLVCVLLLAPWRCQCLGRWCCFPSSFFFVVLCVAPLHPAGASSSFGWCCFVGWPLGRPGN